MFVGSIDGKIKRWDLSGEGKKKEIEIVKTIEKNEKNSKKIVAVGSTTEIEEKKIENIENEKSLIKYPRRRFLDFYFEDAIIAEEVRRKAVAAGGDGKYVIICNIIIINICNTIFFIFNIIIIIICNIIIIIICKIIIIIICIIIIIIIIIFKTSLSSLLFVTL